MFSWCEWSISLKRVYLVNSYKTTFRTRVAYFLYPPLTSYPHSEDIDNFTDIKFDLNLLVYDRNTFGYLRSYSLTFVNCRKMFGSFLWIIFAESSERGRNSLGKRLYQYVYIINKIMHGCS